MYIHVCIYLYVGILLTVPYQVFRLVTRVLLAIARISSIRRRFLKGYSCVHCLCLALAVERKEQAHSWRSVLIAAW